MTSGLRPTSWLRFRPSTPKGRTWRPRSAWSTCTTSWVAATGGFTSVDSTECPRRAYGFVCLGDPQCAEWGTITFRELYELWRPPSFGETGARWRDQDRSAPHR